jgi:flagellar basal-body rod protein FlgB
MSVIADGTFFAQIALRKELDMQIEGIFSSTVDLLGKSVDLRAKSQNLISSNIANAETPNFIPKTLVFEQELQGALKNRQPGQLASSAPNARHIPIRGTGTYRAVQSVSGNVIETPAKTPGKDGNAVELEDEMSKMAENQIMFNASVQLLSKQFADLRTAIKGAL